jgi:IS5 family transposase
MGGKQLGFSDYEITTAKKQTKREKFLSEMEVVVPWQALIELIEPHYPKASKKGVRPLRWTGFSGQPPSLTSEAGYRP